MQFSFAFLIDTLLVSYKVFLMSRWLLRTRWLRQQANPRFSASTAVIPRTEKKAAGAFQWPFIHRKSITNGIQKAILGTKGSPDASITWVVGPRGCGKTTAIMSTPVQASQAVALQFDFLSTEEQNLDELGTGMEQSLRKQILRAWFKEWTIPGVYQGICDFYQEYLGCEFDQVLPEYLASSHLSQLVRHNVTGYKLWALTVQHGGDNSDDGALELSSKILMYYLKTNNIPNRTSIPIKLLLYLSAQKLKKDQKLALCLFHVDVADRSPSLSTKAGHPDATVNLLPQLMNCTSDIGANLILECDDNITQISMIDPDRHGIVELSDFTMGSVRHVFVPSLLSDRPTATAEGRVGDDQRDDAGHFDALWSLFGGHPATLRKLSEYFDEATKIDKAERTKKEMEMRENIKRGKKRDIVSPHVFEGTIRKNDALRNCATVLMSTDPSAPLRADLAIFDEQIAELMNSRPLQNIRRGLADLSSGAMCPVEYKVVVLESVRYIVKRCMKEGGIVVPAGLSLADIRHPVVVGMLHANLLSCKWKPVPRIQIANVLTARLLIDWADSEFDAMNAVDKAKYNLTTMRNRKDITGQVDHLGLRGDHAFT